MKKLVFLSLFILLGHPFWALASISSKVIIMGKITSKFQDDRAVSAKDQFGQEYIIPKNLFPRPFNFSNRKQQFSLEVTYRNYIEFKEL